MRGTYGGPAVAPTIDMAQVRESADLIVMAR